MSRHYIATVKDSINDYREVQSTYFDGTEGQARKYFRNVLFRYFGDTRYQVIMQTNPIVLQDAGE